MFLPESRQIDSLVSMWFQAGLCGCQCFGCGTNALSQSAGGLRQTYFIHIARNEINGIRGGFLPYFNLDYAKSTSSQMT